MKFEQMWNESPLVLSWITVSLCDVKLSPGVFENVPSPVDEKVKVAVIRDTLRLMDPQKKKRKDTQ